MGLAAAGLAASRRTRTAAGTMLVRLRSFWASGRLTTVLLPVMVALAFSLPAAAVAAAEAAAGTSVCMYVIVLQVCGK
jgi:hypothetical protein